MKKLKVFLSVLFSIFILLSTVLTCSADDTVGEKTYQGQTGSFSVVSFNTLPYRFQVKLNYDWFVYGDNTVYYSNLAQLAATATYAVYATDGNTSDGNIPGYSTAFFEALGFDDVERVDVKSETGYDKKDVTNFIAGHKALTRDGKKYEVIFITVRGSFLAEDWESNFDVGADTDSYYGLTGEHPEWLESQKDLHKGFAIAGNRAKSKIDAYVSANVDPSAEKIIMLTGHSRGGAIANILGTFFEDDTENYKKAFTYTFAAATTTTGAAEEVSKYKTIFNIINKDDIIPFVPPTAWSGFKRFGTDLVASTTAYSSMYQDITGSSYISANGSSIAAEWAKIADSREALYEFDYSDKGTANQGAYASIIAQTLYSTLENNFKNQGVQDYVDLKKEKSGFLYKVYFSCRPAYILHLFSDLLTSDNLMSAATNFLEYPMPTDYYLIFSNVIEAVQNESAIDSHLLASYYCIASGDFGYDQTAFMPESELTGSVFHSYGTYTILGAVIIVLGIALLIVKKKAIRRA